MKRHVMRWTLSRLFAFSGVLSDYEMYSTAVDRHRIRNALDMCDIAPIG